VERVSGLPNRDFCGNFAGFSQGAGFWKIPIPKENPAKIPMF
jgi:hypothetical protein